MTPERLAQMPWTPSSWRQKSLLQAPKYSDLSQLQEVESRLSQFPPLVFEAELIRFEQHLAQVEKGEAFLLQGGDCAENLADLQFDTVRDNFRVLLQMAVVLTFGMKRPVVKVGRMAGQFAKPRSAEGEIRQGIELPVYRGDIINGHAFDERSRAPDPLRMERAYFHSSSTLNLLRALATGGFADLQRIHAWNLQFVHQERMDSRYAEVAERIGEAMAFMKATGMNLASAKDLSTVEFFTSHEALLLNYEEALTRRFEHMDRYYSGSAHMLWIGDRTRQLDGAHVEFARGLANPIGLKCGPSLQAEELIRLIDQLNPQNIPGHLTLITRFGAEKIEAHLPDLIRQVQREGRRVVWCCDPMHGNTFTTEGGFKTRSFENILSEMRCFFEIHRAEGSVPGGVHLELTGRNVVECIGGGQDILASQLVF